MRPARALVSAGLLLLAAAVAARAQDAERIKPKEPKPKAPPTRIETPAPKADGDTTPLVAALRGIRFVPRQRDVAKAPPTVTGIDTAAVPFLGTEAFRKQIEPFLGRPVSMAALMRIRRITMIYYQQHDRPFVEVAIPEQDITTGVVQLVVYEATAGTMTVTGNRHFRDGLFLRRVRFPTGEPIRASHIVADIDGLNRNAFRTVRPVFSPGKQPGTSDLELQVADRFPLRVFTGFENSGSRSTGRGRLLGGFNWGNAFGLDHELSYQVMADSTWHRSRSHSLVYRAPLPNGHMVVLNGSVSEYSSPAGNGMDQDGDSWEIGGRYVVPLPAVGSWRHQVGGGFNWKSYDSDLQFGGATVFANTVRIAQFAFDYSGSAPDDLGATSLAVSLYASPGWFHDSDDKDHFTAARAETDPEYLYATASLQRQWALPWRMSLVNRLAAQVASDRLQSSEQFGVGGYTSVRGYDERVANGDQGLFASIELRSPEWLLGTLSRGRTLASSLQLLAFCDYGVATARDQQPGERASLNLLGTGLGLRYRMGDHVDLRCDYAWPLRDIPFERQPAGQFHFGLIASY